MGKKNRSEDQYIKGRDHLDSERKRAEEEVKRRAENLKAINELAIELAAAPPDADLFKLVAEKLKQITGALATAVTAYDPQTKDLTIKHLAVRKQSLIKIDKLLKRKLIGMRFPVSPAMFKWMSTKVVATFKDLSEITFGEIPKPAAAAIQKMFGTGEITGFVLHYGGEIVGTAGIIMPKGKPPPPPDVMHTFTNLVTVTLRRRKAEQALRNSEERYRTLQSNLPLGVFRTTPEGNLLSVNPAMIKMLGYKSKEEFKPVPIVDVYVDLHQREEFVKRLQKEGSVTDFEIQLMRKDGSIFWVSMNATFVVDAEGKILYYDGVFEDITERKKAEEALKKSEERYRTIFAFSPEAIVYLDMQRTLLAANKRVYDWLGYRPEEVVGKNVTELPFLTKDSTERIKKNFILRMQGKEIPPYEIDCIAKSGKKEVGRVVATPVKDEAGKIVADLVMVSNITSRKQTEKERDRHRRELQTLFGGVDTLLWSIREEPDGELYYEQVNAAFASVEGHTPEHYNGMRISDLHSPQECGAIRKSVEMAKRGKPHIYDVQFKNGHELKHFAMRFIPLIEPDCEIRRFIGSGVDITDRKKAEEAVNKRLLYEQALAYCSQILFAIENLDDAMLGVVEKLRSVVDTSSVCIFQNLRGPKDDTCVRLVHEAVAEGVESQINDPFLKHLPCSKLLEYALDNLSMGEVHHEGIVSELPKKEQKILESQGVRSFLNIPIRTENKLWGLISLRDYVNERIWKQDDIHLLRTVGSMIGTTIERQQAEKELQRHTRAIEGLYDLSQQINQAVNLDDLLGRTSALLENNPGVLAGGIYLLDGQAGCLRLKRAFGPGSEFFGQEEVLVMEDPYVKQVLETSGVMVTDRWRDGKIALRVSKGKEVAGQMISVAMRSGEETLGIFSMILIKADEYTTSFVETVGAELGVGVGHKQAEQALLESEKKYRLISENTSDLIAVTTFGLNPTYIYISPSHRALGYEPEDMFGKSAFDFVHPGDKKKLFPLLKKYAGAKVKKLLGGKVEGISERIEYRVKDKWESWHYMESVVNVVEDHLLFISRDITERKQAEEKLKLSEEKYKSIVELAPEGIITVDLKGVVTSCNSAFLSLTGFSAPEIIGKHISKLPTMWARDIPKYLKLFGSAIKGKLPKSSEFAWLRKDGTTRWGDVHASMMKKDGKTVGFQAILIDITERKRAELHLRVRAQLLDRLREAKTIEDCLQLGCEAVRDAGLFARAVFTIKNEKGETTHLAQIGIDPELVERLDRNPPASEWMLKQMLRPEFKISHSYFIPREAGVDFEQTGRYIPQESETDECPDSWKRGDELLASMLGMDGSTEGYLSVDTPVNGKRPDKETILYLEDIVDIVARQIHEIQNINALRESEERYRVLTEEALVGVYITSRRRFLFANPSMEKITGYSRDELLEMDIYSIILPQDVEAIKERKKQRKTGQSDQYTMRIKRKDGEIAILEVRIRPITCQEESAYLGNCIDITKSIRQRKQIEQAKQEWERTFDAIPDLVMILAPDRRVLRANRAVAEYTGLSFNELVGESYLKVFHLENQKGPLNEDISAVEFGIAEYIEIIDPKTKRMFSVSGSSLLDSKGEIIATVHVARDVTQMREFEQALMESELQFRGLAESAKDIIFSVDADGSILYLSPAFKESIGRNPNDFIGVNVRDFFDSPELNTETRKVLSRCLSEPIEGGYIPLLEVKARDAKGHRHVLEISARFLSGQFIGIARDVTERKRMEQQLLRASKLASIGVLAAGLGHQVNNPLASILATSTVLKEMLSSSKEVPERLRKKAAGYLTIMEQQLDRAHQIVSSLLEFAKENRMDVGFHNVNHIVREALQFLLQHLSFKDISLELRLDENLPFASVDHEVLQQVIVNVIQNAYEAMEGSGRLVIRTEKEKEDTISIAISNDGPPIPKGIQEEIFELLFTTKTAQKGTGLGLPVSVMLLEHFGGSIYLEDSTDKETIFVIEVPTHGRRKR